MENYIGIDVAKHTFDLCCLGKRKIQQFENNKKGIAKAAKMHLRMPPLPLGPTSAVLLLASRWAGPADSHPEHTTERLPLRIWLEGVQNDSL